MTMLLSECVCVYRQTEISVGETVTGGGRWYLVMDAPSPSGRPRDRVKAINFEVVVDESDRSMFRTAYWVRDGKVWEFTVNRY